MALDSVGAWLWDKFGKDITDKALGKAKEYWAEFKWNDAAQSYRDRVKYLYSTTRMLGKPQPVSLEGIFTDVYLLDKPTAYLHYDVEQLKQKQKELQSSHDEVKRINALRLVSQQDQLFILGKPGAGKTTFLKYLTLQAAQGKLERVPIFISLNEWASSGLELMPFIVRQFEICAFPDAEFFIKHLLKQKQAMVCFDGLDEVNEANEQRANTTTAINDFAKQYPGNKHLITCRMAATDYTFDKFTYVEVADFTLEQIQTFTHKWFSHEPNKAERFLSELSKEEHRGLRELAQTPLLLTLLCLNFEETLAFPPRRAELYEEAIDALLKKWDTTRNIKRDEIYRTLSLGRKRQLFSRIAAEYFEQGEIFFPQIDLAGRVTTFLRKLPGADTLDEPDGETIVKAIEAQHSIFVERAHRIYSFSHLTLQEFFTARYIVENAADGLLQRLIDSHLFDDRWREVFLLVTSMLPDAYAFMQDFKRGVDRLIADDGQLAAYGEWVSRKAAEDYQAVGHPAIARAIVRAIAEYVDFARDLTYALDLERARGRVLDFVSALDRVRALASALDFDLANNVEIDHDRLSALNFANDLNLDLEHAPTRIRAQVVARAVDIARDFYLQRNIDQHWSFKIKQRWLITQYEKATILLAECLQLAAMSKAQREEIEISLLTTPS